MSTKTKLSLGLGAFIIIILTFAEISCIYYHSQLLFVLLGLDVCWSLISILLLVLFNRRLERELRFRNIHLYLMLMLLVINIAIKAYGVPGFLR
jgi:hypothetical protein